MLSSSTIFATLVFAGMFITDPFHLPPHHIRHFLIVWNVIVFFIWVYDNFLAVDAGHGYGTRQHAAENKNRWQHINESRLLFFLFLGAPLGTWLGLALNPQKWQKWDFLSRVCLYTVINLAWPMMKLGKMM